MSFLSPWNIFTGSVAMLSSGSGDVVSGSVIDGVLEGETDGVNSKGVFD